AQEDVRGIVITHGTDTLEETAYFLLSVLPIAALARKPVVLTCAMRPATALAPDGPQNLLDAVAVANASGACGVLVVCAGVLHCALDVQKVHPYRLDAFGSGDSGPLGYLEEGVIRLVKNWPAALVGCSEGASHSIASGNRWPRVELVLSHAGVSGAVVDALLSQEKNGLEPLRGLVVAGTGNGSVHQDLEVALLRAQARGVRVWRGTRCALGRVLPTPGQRLPDSSGLSPVKARIALMLSLLD
ncbi:MAG: asparaginase, partial [Burkholderiales bacterium]|nr:asparaginase [Burkholderiales bacterium]